MRDTDEAIAVILSRYGEAFDPTNIWRVQGQAVISHKTLERIAAQAKIAFDVPTIIRAERDEAVMLVVGRMADRMEWSVGECVVNVNYRVSGRQAAYVWAMAEKRAKDRVILKLINLHGLIYSEEEADDFKGGRDAERPAGNGEVKSARQAKKDGDWERLTGALASVDQVSVSELLLWPWTEREAFARLRTDWQEELVEIWSKAFEETFASACHNRNEIRKFDALFGAAIAQMPAAFTAACDRVVKEAIEHHRRAAQPMEAVL